MTLILFSYFLFKESTICFHFLPLTTILFKKIKPTKIILQIGIIRSTHKTSRVSFVTCVIFSEKSTSWLRFFLTPTKRVRKTLSSSQCFDLGLFTFWYRKLNMNFKQRDFSTRRFQMCCNVSERERGRMEVY